MNNVIRSSTTACLLLLSMAAAAAAQVAMISDPGSRTLVTAEELVQSNRSNLFDFLRAKRPLWLQSRGAVGIGSVGVVVYLDGIRMGDTNELRGISPLIVSQIRYLSGPEATTRWGAGHSEGAIVISTAPIERDRAAGAFAEALPG